MSSIITLPLTSIQGGNWVPFSGTWAPASTIIATNVELWGVFDKTSLGGSLIHSGTVTFITFTGGDYILDLLVYKLPRITDFDSSSPPLLREEYVGAATFTTTPFGIGSEFANIDLPLHTADGRATATLNALRSTSPTDALGQQRFAFGARVNPASPVTGALVAILTNYQLTVDPQFTGLSGPWEARGRADECPKCGGKSTRDTWVRDGYTNMMVCPHCYDEEDTVGRHYQGLGSERPGQGEG